MMRRLLLTVLAAMPLALSGLASASTSKPMLDESALGKLAQSVGISSPTAQAALGSMLMLTQRRVETGQFQQVAGYIPRWSEYIDAGREAGAFAESISTPAELNQAFTKLGMTTEQVAKFVPAITDYLEKVGGGEVAAIMKGALR
jgi:hypothetical protein